VLSAHCIRHSKEFSGRRRTFRQRAQPRHLCWAFAALGSGWGIIAFPSACLGAPALPAYAAATIGRCCFRRVPFTNPIPLVGVAMFGGPDETRRCLGLGGALLTGTTVPRCLPVHGVKQSVGCLPGHAGLIWPGTLAFVRLVLRLYSSAAPVVARPRWPSGRKPPADEGAGERAVTPGIGMTGGPGGWWRR